MFDMESRALQAFVHQTILARPRARSLTACDKPPRGRSLRAFTEKLQRFAPY